MTTEGAPSVGDAGHGCRRCGAALQARAAVCGTCGEPVPGHQAVSPDVPPPGPVPQDILARVAQREVAATTAGAASISPGVVVALVVGTVCLALAFLAGDRQAGIFWGSLAGAAFGWLLTRGAILSALRQWRREGGQ